MTVNLMNGVNNNGPFFFDFSAGIPGQDYEFAGSVQNPTEPNVPQVVPNPPNGGERLMSATMHAHIREPVSDTQSAPQATNAAEIVPRAPASNGRSATANALARHRPRA